METEKTTAELLNEQVILMYDAVIKMVYHYSNIKSCVRRLEIDVKVSENQLYIQEVE